VGEAAIVLELVVPLIKVGGRAVLWKKRDIEDELTPGRRAATTLGARLLLEQPVTLPGLPEDRQLVVFLKERPTDGRYPRAAGMPKKNPLGGA
jgi:16S rRNA (guanine527-N7)-methyltransferase